ncbi:MAG: 1-acyl-sn-glycerol-3-phosphate acyltransferase [Clostridiales bacterium]|nr:1-acyl-sn-glycerol-3-phosphate acyltransferase [Clostridiales bacterium]
MRVIKSIVHFIVLLIAVVVVHIFFPQKVIGRKYYKNKSGCIIYSNHISAWDPVVLAVALAPRKVYFMAKEELFKSKLLAWIMDALGAFPVSRGNADMTAIRTSINHIEKNHVIVVFPEGTRNEKKDGSLTKFHNGISIIAIKTRCNLYPVYIDCKNGYKLFKRYRIIIGKDVNLQDFYLEGIKKDNLNRSIDELKNKIMELM